MNLVQNPFLWCLLLEVFCASEKPTDRPNGEDLPPIRHYPRVNYPKHWRNAHVAEKVGNTIDLKTKCFCVIEDPSNPKVPQLLNFRGNTLKRLVVYLYQDDNTGTIKMHIPNRGKQKMLPDLTYDHNDIIASATDTLVSDIVQSDSSITVPNANPQFHYQVKPKILNKQKIQHFGNNKPNVIKAFKYNINPPESHSGTHYGPNDVYETTTNQAIRKNNLNVITSELENIQQNKIIKKLNNGHEDSNSDETPVQYDSLTASEQSVEDRDMTFDSWLVTQIKTVKKQGILHHNSVNFNTLRKLIENTLHQNGITLTKYGTLLDSGKAHIDMANLKLRIVLIGKPTNFDSLINGIGTHNMLPTDVPYLEAFFLNLIRPWKILGVIPLGVILIPNGVNQAKSYKKLQIDLSRSGTNEKNLQESIPEEQIQSSNEDSALVVDAKENPLEIEENSRNSYELFVEGKQGNDNDQQSDNWQKQYQQQLVNFNRQAEETKSTVNENVNDTASETVSDNDEKANEQSSSPPSDLNRLINSRRHNNYYNSHSLMPWNDFLENSKKIIINHGNHHRHYGYDGSNDELPNYRIIGGFPATSSGYPLRVKGRIGILKKIANKPVKFT